MRAARAMRIHLRRRGTPGWRRETGPRQTRGARVAALTAATVLAILAALPAAAADGQAVTALPAPASVVITSISPAFAIAPHTTVTVTGFITNTTGAPLTGLSIQLYSASTPLGSRAAMATYLSAAGAAGVDVPVPSAGASATVPDLAAHATQRWSLSLRPADVGMTSFGVYPLAAQAMQGGSPLTTGHARTFLPYYPPQPAHSTQQKLNIAWVWPLIDTPQQAVCSSLLSDGLAASIAPSGRLGGLLAAGASPAGRRDQITWAIDPAVLNGVSAMTQPYRVGGSATCGGGSARPPSTAARAFRDQLRAATASSDFFVTPYADVDVAALSHQGLDSELGTAFSIGRSAARGVLGAAQRPAAGVANAGATAGAAAGSPAHALNSAAGLGWLAWPANGIADYGVLGSLAVNGVGTVVLDGSMMPPAAAPLFTPSGVTTTSTGVGTDLHVLLTDDGLDQVVASAPNASAPAAPAAAGPARVTAAAAAFATRQEFLAQTAMIVAEAPATSRSVIVAPPRRWNPASGVAQALLAETAQAPWLNPVSLATLAGGKRGAGEVPRSQPPQSRVRPQELRPALLRQVRQLDLQIQLQASILTPQPEHYLGAAVAAAESSAWRGSRAGRRSAEALLQRIQAYLTAQQSALRIVDPPRVTLGGKSGAVPVSISNRLAHNVTVVLKVSAPSSNRIVFGRSARQYSSKVMVAAGTQKTIKIPVQSAVAGSTTLTVQLWTPGPDSSPLPGESAALTVQATHFGTLALVIIGIAFGVFVLTSIGRAVRRGGGRPGETDPDAGPETAGDTGEDALSHPIPASESAGPATVGTGRQDDERAPEEPDEHASARGRAEPR